MFQGMEENAREGRYNGGHGRYGFVYDREGRRLVPHPDESSVVRTIYALRYRDELTQDEIAECLFRAGIPTRSGKARWSRRQIGRILDHPAYLGVLRWSHVAKPGAHEPLVTRAELARWRVEGRRRRAGR